MTRFGEIRSPAGVESEEMFGAKLPLTTEGIAICVSMSDRKRSYVFSG